MACRILSGNQTNLGRTKAWEESQFDSPLDFKDLNQKKNCTWLALLQKKKKKKDRGAPGSWLTYIPFSTKPTCDTSQALLHKSTVVFLPLLISRRILCKDAGTPHGSPSLSQELLPKHLPEIRVTRKDEPTLEAPGTHMSWHRVLNVTSLTHGKWG